MNGLWVFVDVDLTLMDKDDNPRPYIVEFFKTLKRLNCNVVVWSAGGDKYAESKINMASNRLSYTTNSPVDLKQYIRSFLSKGMKLLVPRPAFYIDDMEDLLQAKQRDGNGVYKVPAYESSVMPYDTALVKAADAVKRFIEKRKKVST